MGESELYRPALNLRNQLVAIKLRSIDRHPPIVKTLHLPDEAATASLARALATLQALQDAFISLHGNLGSGKTTLVRYWLQALGVTGRIKSPTYAVVETYALPTHNIWHFDFYRFNDPQEWEDAGFRDVFASAGLKLAEWPEKAATFLPAPDLQIHLDTVGTSMLARLATLTGHTALGRTALEALP